MSVTQKQINKYLEDNIYFKCDELLKYFASQNLGKADCILICFTMAGTLSKECSRNDEPLPIQPLINEVVDSLVTVLLTDEGPTE